MSEQIHMGDVGTSFDITVYEGGELKDLSTAHQVTLKFRKPDNSVVSKSGTLVTDGTDGQVRYITEVDFLDSRGQWDLQVVVNYPGEPIWHSNIVHFHVHPNI